MKGMLKMDETNYITALQKFEGLPMREIVRRTGYHFNTVKKYVDCEDWNLEVKPRKQKPSRLDLLKPVIDDWLKKDLRMPRKQRHTGVRIFERLKDEYEKELTVGQQTVINYVSKRKKELCKSTFDTAIKGYHPPGQAQLDFGEVYVYNKNNTMKKYYELVISFPASNGAYVQLCKSQNQECLLEGMQRIFNYMHGVPTRILFDNMSTAVAKILPKRQRKLTDGFSRFVLHHRFNAAFCNPNKGQEKGHVETKVGYKRRNFMVPIPVIHDLNKYNEELLELCDKDMDRVHYEKNERIDDLFKLDVQAFLALPKKPFKVSRLEKVKTDNYSFARFENNRYSTAPAYNRCEVWLEISADEIRVLNEKYEEIAVHTRNYDLVGAPIIDWLKYLPAITRKPNAFKYTAFFQTMPIVWQEYFNSCGVDEGKKMLNVLSPIIVDGKLDQATIAMEHSGVTDADSFLAYYRKLTEPSKYLNEVHTTNMPIQKPYKQSLADYSKLMGGDE